MSDEVNQALEDRFNARGKKMKEMADAYSELQAENAKLTKQASDAAVAAAGWKNTAEGLQSIEKERDAAIAAAEASEAKAKEDVMFANAGIRHKHVKRIVQDEWKDAVAADPKLEFDKFFNEFKAKPPQGLEALFGDADTTDTSTPTEDTTTPTEDTTTDPRVLPGNQGTRPTPNTGKPASFEQIRDSDDKAWDSMSAEAMAKPL